MRDPNPDRPTWKQILCSILAAFCGIQSNSNHDRDDAYIDKVGFVPYIVAGVAMTAAFVLLLWFIVQLVLSA